MSDAIAAFREFRRHGGLDLAASVAFYTLLSLAPLGYVTGVVLGTVFRDSAALGQAIHGVSRFLPSEAAAALPALVEHDLALGGRLLPLAFPALVWVATVGLQALERAINVAFDARHRRRPWRSRAKPFVALAVGVSVLVLSLVIRAFVLSLQRAAGVPAPPSAVAGAATWIAVVGLAFLAFAFIYHMLPSGRARWSSACAGAAFAIVPWELSRHLFGTVLLRSPAFGLLTGAVAGLVAFLLWIYTSVAIVLLGAEFAALRDGRRPTGAAGPVGPGARGNAGVRTGRAP